ncbi:MAG: acyl-CoA dehydrogenase protein [Acidimicrobiales bacterium]|nr:acyl-CoA dehydrogenase protein [Acidimicrobiales bacterium]
MTATDLDEAGLAEQFRGELRAWLEEHFTAEVAATVADRQGLASLPARRRWNAALVDAGYGAVSWPVEHGGRGAGILEQLAWYEEMARVDAPGPVNVIGVANIAPAIMAVGTAAQQERFLAPMLRGDEIWCQGMSEPDAGSDLAALRCAAVADGDQFVVNGSKTWNSLGDRADWCQLYVRTDPRASRHEGITCLLVDMTLPGIEARPIRSMSGEVGFAELFFQDVVVPADAVLGEVGAGWAVATRTLSNERAGVAGLYLHLRATFDQLVAAASEPAAAGGDRPVDHPVARDALARRYSEIRILEFLAKRTLGTMLRGGMPGAEGSVLKLAWAQWSQALANTAVDVLGMPALDGPWAVALSGSRSLTIAGGTTEVNKNIVGDRVLGLPREPRVG